MSALEFATIRVQRFRTPEGKPTCSTGPDAATTCRLLLKTRGGLEWSCAVQGAGSLYLDRYGAEGLGHLIPAERCPVWSDQ